MLPGAKIPLNLYNLFTHNTTTLDTSPIRVLLDRETGIHVHPATHNQQRARTSNP